MSSSRIRRPLYGEYRRPVDEKGRVSVPAEFRPILQGERGSFFLNRGFEKCIMGYPERKWERVLDLVDDVSLDDRNTRWFKRTFYSGAREVSCDQQGRVLLPQVLAKYAGISKEVVIVGLSDFIEVWDAEAWDSWLAQSMDSYEKIAEKLIESAAPGKESTNETATNS
jgi:MraZ protein